MINYDKENYELALKQIQKSIDISKDDPHNFLIRAFIKYEMKNIKRNVKDCQISQK